ncbi:restriction endonuclease [Kitasatospora sp. NPDC058397]|uniref:restriction endonuclease n=1 Tax=unclassified Kitasatospora TaxID=2633591 RepID=UPI003652168E
MEQWARISADPSLQTPPSPGTPGNTPPGEDLNLRIGWDRFEKLLLAVVQGARGLREVRFRRYGVQGQAQHGIDLAGREPDGEYTVVQCKDYQRFTAADLRAAVELFANGVRPFGANRIIVATSASTLTTQVAEELAALQTEHPDLDLDLWGAEQINEHLRYQGDVVARFWTRETAAAFSTGAPLPGVPAPHPDRQEQADRILLGPLNTDDVKPLLREAQTNQTVEPAEAARLYGRLASRFTEAGFRGHATVLSRRQLDALRAAGRWEEAAGLAARLAAAALHHADRYEARRLGHLLQELTGAAAEADPAQASSVRRHMRLVDAAIQQDGHPFGEFSRLRAVLNEEHPEEDYRPLLVLNLAEAVLAVEPDQVESLDELLGRVVDQIREGAATEAGDGIAIRLRLVRAEYDADERRALLRSARLRRVSGRYRALINAREARRLALGARAEEALECWREAVSDAILAGMAEEAADWLYAIRALNVQYGPLTTEIDEEHRLAQALRGTGTARLLDRVRDPREQAMSALVANQPVGAVHAGRRWLIESVVTGSWADECEALSFLGDRYAENSEPALAAAYYQRAGDTAKVKELAVTVGDRLLAVQTLGQGPWWELRARAVLVSAQVDLVDDDSAAVLLEELTEIASCGRRGELTESPTFALTTQATKTACALAGRGTPRQAHALLNLLSPDVPREPNHYRYTDAEHATACLEIALAHPGVAMRALSRLIDLADLGVEKAVEIMLDDRVLRSLGAGRTDAATHWPPSECIALTDEQRIELRVRACGLDARGHYLASVIRHELDPAHLSARARAEQARDRILSRPAPDPHRTEFGTAMVTDSYLVCSLAIEDQQACLTKLETIAKDNRETASTRQDALTALRNLVMEQSGPAKRAVFLASKSFVAGDRDGSAHDELTGEAHPLSFFKISLGSASLRGHGLQLAGAAAATDEDHGWVAEQAVGLLRSDDPAEVRAAALVFGRLPGETTLHVDVDLLSTHSDSTVREASAVLCMRRPRHHRNTAVRLAHDNDFRVRRTLAAAARASASSPDDVRSVLELLATDPRHSVRRAARI